MDAQTPTERGLWESFEELSVRLNTVATSVEAFAQTAPELVSQAEKSRAREEVEAIWRKNREFLQVSEDFNTLNRAEFKRGLRNTYEEIATEVTRLRRLVRDVDPNPNVQDCNGSAAPDDTFLVDLEALKDIDNVVKSDSTLAPYSFDSSHWEKEGDWMAGQIVDKSAWKVNWETLGPYLVKYLTNKNYEPSRYRTDKKDDVDGEGLPKVSQSTRKSFDTVKNNTRLNKITGALVYVTMDEDQKYTTRRVVWRTDDRKNTFTRVWNDPLCGAHRGRDSFYTYWSKKFIGVSRQGLDMMIRETELNQIQRTTKAAQKVTNPLVTSNPMEHLQMDLVIFESNAAQNDGFAYILVVVDCFSKFLWTYPLKQKYGSEILSKLKQLFQTEGFPVILQSDNGSEFVDKQNQEYFEKCGITFRTSRAYRPQTQGQVERTNRTLKQAIYQDMLQSDNLRWIDFLSDYTMSYNTMTHTSTGYTPFEVHRGRKMGWMPNRADRNTNVASQFLSVRKSSEVPEATDVEVPLILADETLTLIYANPGMLPSVLDEYASRSRVADEPTDRPLDPEDAWWYQNELFLAKKAGQGPPDPVYVGETTPASKKAKKTTQKKRKAPVAQEPRRMTRAMTAV